MMNNMEEMEIERACHKLVTAYCHYVDHGRASKIADLFTHDGIWASSENEMNGRDEIKAGFLNRESNKGRMSRHICNNFVLHQISETQASGCTYLTLYRHDGDPDRQFSPLDGPTMVGEYRDEFALTAEGWRIKRREAHVDFIHSNKPSGEKSG